MPRKRSDALLQQIQRTVSHHQMLARGDRVLVAVSGGPDSIALLAALSALGRGYGITLHAAHLNHRLRAAESERDRECAAAVAASLGIPCTVESTELLVGSANLEARARALRYDFFERTAATHGCTKIATGHTLDDQAETVLMRLLRGTGTDGLVGICAVRGHIIRPLIQCSRQQVLTFLEHAQLPFCNDSSNADRRFLRNRVRHDVLPVLESINPDIRHRLAVTAEIVAAESRWMDEWVEQMLAPLDAPDGSLAVGAVVRVPAALQPRLVRAWLRARRGDLRGVLAAHVDAIVALARGRRPNARVRLPAGQVVRAYDRIHLRAPVRVGAPEPPTVLLPGSTVHLASGWTIRADLAQCDPTAWRRPANLWSMVADADRVASPIVVRTAHAGDRLRPLGLRGHRKLQDIFVDHKLPLDSRRTCPIIECGGEILWVPGVVRADSALVTPTTRQTLRLLAAAPEARSL